MSLSATSVDPLAVSGTVTTPATGLTGGNTSTTTATTTGSTTTSATTGSTGTTSATVLPPPGIVIQTQTFHSDSNWPATLILDKGKGNWEEWDRRLRLIVDQRGFGPYLNGTLACPDAKAHPGSAFSWTLSDAALRAFILEHVAYHEYDIASAHQNSHDAYNALRNSHQNQGPYAQIRLIKEALGSRFNPNTPLTRTFDQISMLHARHIKMGRLKDDQELCSWILNALRDHYPRLQTSVNDMLANPLTTSADIRARLAQEEQVTNEKGNTEATTDTALAAAHPKPPRPTCLNCKKSGHKAEHCIAIGGGMAGKTLDEAREAARNANRATNGKSRRLESNTANTATTQTLPTNTATIVLNGQTFTLTPSNAQPPNADNNRALITMPPYDEDEYIAVIATTDASKQPDYAYAEPSPITRSIDLPFILDSGATCHISPEASDFTTLNPIPRRPVKGLAGAAVYAIGIGDIELRVTGGHTLKLTDALYIPESSVRLVSILALNKSGNYTTHFDSNGCWVTNKANATLVRGALSEAKRLYVLATNTPLIQRQPESALLSRVPDIETWHRRLGHCNTRAIVEMATGGVSQGMPIDLSTLPPTCEHCAIGKQTRAPVPKVRQGPKANERLGRVYVDLCGPMAVVSRTSNLYLMNIIDDFSGYVWCIPLRSKSDALPNFQVWHKAVTVQTGNTLRILVTDNGELVSNAMRSWCDSLGIDHQLTAPYTSAQNGRVERLHRTILGKARTMRIACNAPGNLWDEFCSTAAYLTNLTAATANQGRTPYELWFGRLPSLSHLREIGCSAYALHTPSPSKIYARSLSCILIGYAPHSKAYRLWDPVSSRVFNSFHVSFAEHLESSTIPFRPGTLLGTTTAATPPSWDVSGPAPPTSERHPFSSYNDPSSSLNPHADPLTASAPFSTIPFPTIPAQSNNTTNQTQQNTVNEQSNTVTQQNNTVTQQSNTVTQHNNTVTVQSNTVIPQDTANQHQNNNENQQSNTVTQQNNNTAQQHANQPPNPPQTRLTITIPPRPPLRRSPRIQAQHNDQAYAFLSEYCTLRDSHDLFPTDILADSSLPCVDDVLTALSDGSLTPEPTDEDDEPLWEHAIASDEREYWIAGGRDELKSLEDLKVFVLVPRTDIPRGQRALKGKLVCKRKRDDTGKVVRYKVRYVAKGFAQRYGIDYDKTTAPTVRMESIRTILHIAAALDWDLRQFDIKTAFLHGILPEDETMFMEQPPGFAVPGKEEWVMRLMKSIYGMKQASRIWNQTFHAAVSKWGFTRLECEWCVYRRSTPTGTVIFLVHVDDIVAAGSSPQEIESFRDQLKAQWEITELGEPRLALGIAISRDRTNHTISLSQTVKIDPLVNDYGQLDARPVDTPMVTGLQLRRPDKSAPVPAEIVQWMDRTPYRRLVGSLMYLAIATRPDIAYAVGRLSSFLDCYRPEHWEAAIRVLRYLKGTRTHTLVLGGRTPLTLMGYSDSDYANCLDTSRSVGGYCFTLGSGMTSWCSRKQPTVADSSCYAEYIALHDAAHEVIFLRQLLEGIKFLPSGATQLLCDNDAASRLAEDHVWHSHTKHIRVKYHFTRELVDSGDLIVKRVGSKDNIADILTKPLSRPDFQRLRHYLGIRAAANPDSE
jgi:transposase InsO family protein